MKKAVLIYNPSSGKELATEYKDRVVDVLNSMDYEVDLKETQGPKDATRFATQACEHQVDFVVGMGGDGTINEIVNGLAEQQHMPLFSFIPLGTVNDFARALGIPLDPEEAIEALKTGKEQRADIGKLGTDYFMNIVAIGEIASKVADTSIESKTRLGPLAYLLEGTKAILQDNEVSMKIVHDDGDWEGDMTLVLIALTNSVGGFEKLAPDAEVDDGFLHVFIIHESGIPGFLRVGTKLLQGKLADDNGVTYIRTKKVHIETSQELFCNVDGDEGTCTPVDIQVLAQHLRVLVPEKLENN
ncbi:diacylglycerol kinase [Chryseomicrobium excrementi]|uniref:Diacylglycerol kinase n=1 Tax=Chryseomicrobium excrementi TaxID=2041346 RepID=A0A2M9EX58_9BACL|nr:diacylglycerol kinase family protein [Chryseomicrobium excrementi]PJK15797.1 diacylglycerol kinase [Chryseomicrobium excrementi]